MKKKHQKNVVSHLIICLSLLLLVSVPAVSAVYAAPVSTLPDTMYGDVYLLNYESGTTDGAPSVDSSYHLTKGIVLPGTTFNLVDTDKVKTIVRTAITDDNGQIHFRHIPYGKYNLVEISAPEGYKLHKKEIPVTLMSIAPNAVAVAYVPDSKQTMPPFNQPLIIAGSSLAVGVLAIVAIKLIFVNKEKKEDKRWN